MDKQKLINVWCEKSTRSQLYFIYIQILKWNLSFFFVYSSTLYNTRRYARTHYNVVIIWNTIPLNLRFKSAAAAARA